MWPSCNLVPLAGHRDMRIHSFCLLLIGVCTAPLYSDSSRTSMPETVALFTIGSKVRFSFPCAVGFR